MTAAAGVGDAGHVPRGASIRLLDLDARLRALPIGTRNYKAVLAALIARHNHRHARKDKLISIETRHDRREFFYGFFLELRSQTQYNALDPRCLANRHVQLMVDRWIARSLATSTIHKYLSYLRTFAEWIGKPGMVYPPQKYVRHAPEHAVRTQVARSDRSWTSAGLDIAAKVQEVTAFDSWVGLQLELCWRFAMRSNEARHFRPHEPLYSRAQADARDVAAHPDASEFVHIHRGTKGGRARFVPLTTEEQRALLARLCAAVAPGGFVGNPAHTHLQAQNRFYYVVRRFGICEKTLQVTAHGLRHQQANDFYEAQLGAPSPVRGGTVRSEAELLARDRTSRLLGHSRRQVTSCYLGAAPKTGRAPSVKGT